MILHRTDLRHRMLRECSEQPGAIIADWPIRTEQPFRRHVRRDSVLAPQETRTLRDLMRDGLICVEPASGSTRRLVATSTGRDELARWDAAAAAQVKRLRDRIARFQAGAR
jgi:hypothetical protein